MDVTVAYILTAQESKGFCVLFLYKVRQGKRRGIIFCQGHIKTRQKRSEGFVGAGPVGCGLRRVGFRSSILVLVDLLGFTLR